MPYRKQNHGTDLIRWFAGRICRAGVVLGAAVCAMMTTACDRGDHPGRIGSAAPQFAVSDGSRSVSLSALRGRVVVLNFWASWCVPCIEEAPSLVEMQRRMPQVTVVAISADKDEGAYREFLAESKVNFVTIRDPSMRVQALYGTVKIPDTYVIDREGILRRKFVSAQNWTDPEILAYLGKL
ncbi:MAG TPA: TlpA disulfide reductase family protein [Acidobacteriaceae bacterium]|nr:TlpA disulfide reductase family protein [Acidobacteriaceae bacterium]